eukprot:3093272-Rhodomonas_salina.1
MSQKMSQKMSQNMPEARLTCASEINASEKRIGLGIASDINTPEARRTWDRGRKAWVATHRTGHRGRKSWFAKLGSRHRRVSEAKGTWHRRGKKCAEETRTGSSSAAQTPCGRI